MNTGTGDRCRTLKRSVCNYKLVTAAMTSPDPQESPNLPASDIYAEAKNWAGELISGQTRAGKILVFCVFILSVVSLLVYFRDASA